MKLLKDLFLDELADMYDAERRIAKALPKMAKAATCDKLTKALQAHLKETEGHVKKLEKVFQSFQTKAKGKTCKATVGLVEEANDLAADFKGSPAINAGLISAAQRVEHYEMAAYGATRAMAEQLRHTEVAGLLQETLDEENAAAEKLTEIAKDEVLAGAADAGEDADDEEQEMSGKRAAR